MAGLIEKDIRLMLQRRSALFMLLVISVFMATSTDGSFIIGYVTFLSAIFSMSTLSYDEYDNGYLFLMSLPIDSKTYVFSKYIFSFGCGLISWICALVLMFSANLIKGLPIHLAEDLINAFMIFPLLAIILAFMIPITLKYGAEIGRILLLLISGGTAVALTLAFRLMEHTQAAEPDILTRLDALPPVFFVLIAGLVGLAITGISLLISLRIMKNKSY